MHKREREDVAYEKITAIMSIIVMTVFCFTWIREVDLFTDSLNELVKDVTKNKEIYTWVQWVVCLMHLGEMVEKIKYAANNCKQNNFTQEVFIMKKIKFVIAIIGCFVVLNSLTISASAAYIYV